MAKYINIINGTVRGIVQGDGASITIRNGKIEPPIGTRSTCTMCGEPIEYVGPYWRHLGENQPRHPATPKEEV